MRLGRSGALLLSFIAGGCALERVSIGGGGAVDVGTELDAGLDAGSAAMDAEVEVDAFVAGEDAAMFDAPPGADAPTPEDDAGPPIPPLCPDDPRLVGCWPLDGEALDHGPRGNDLEASAVTFEPAGGVRLDGASSLRRDGTPSLDHDDVTLVAWLRVDAFPGGGQRAGIVDRNGQVGWFVGPMGDLRCHVGFPGAEWTIGMRALTLGEWHHVACVGDPAALVLYVDGVEVAREPHDGGPRSRPPNALHVGENADEGNDQLEGALDDVRIWDAVWSEDEVRDDWRAGRRGSP